MEGLYIKTKLRAQETGKSNKLEMFGLNAVSNMLCYLELIIASKALLIPFQLSIYIKLYSIRLVSAISEFVCSFACLFVCLFVYMYSARCTSDP